MSLSVEKRFRPDEKTEKELLGAYSRLCQVPSSDQDGLVSATRKLAALLKPARDLFPSPEHADAESSGLQSFFFSAYPTELLVYKLAQIDIDILSVLISDPDTACLFLASIVTALLKRVPHHKIGFESFVRKHVSNIATISFVRSPLVDPTMDARLKRIVLLSKKNNADFALFLHETITTSSEACVLELLDCARDVISLDTLTVNGPVIDLLVQNFSLSFLKSVTLLLLPNAILGNPVDCSFLIHVIRRILSIASPNLFIGSDPERVIAWLAQLRSDRRFVLDDTAERKVFDFIITACSRERHVPYQTMSGVTILAHLFNSLQISLVHASHYLEKAFPINDVSFMFIASKCHILQLIQFRFFVFHVIANTGVVICPLLKQAFGELVDKVCSEQFRETLLGMPVHNCKQLVFCAGDYVFDKVFPLIKEMFIGTLLTETTPFDLEPGSTKDKRARYDKIMFEVRMRALFGVLHHDNESNVLYNQMGVQWLLDNRVFKIVGQFVCKTGADKDNAGKNHDAEDAEDDKEEREEKEEEEDEEQARWNFQVRRQLAMLDEAEEDDDEEDEEEEEEDYHQNASPPRGYNTKRIRTD